MKLRILISLLAATLGAMLLGPAFAQNVSPQAEAQLQNWIAKDPRLRSDPGLMNDPTYLKNHPNFATWLQQHPQAHKQVQQMGAYDRNHQWRDTQWWHKNDPDTVYQNHPQWVQNHPEWKKDGDWDDQHHWHDQNWYRQNRKEWAEQHHPEWVQKWKQYHDSNANNQ